MGFMPLFICTGILLFAPKYSLSGIGLILGYIMYGLIMGIITIVAAEENNNNKYLPNFLAAYFFVPTLLYIFISGLEIYKSIHRIIINVFFK